MKVLNLIFSTLNLKRARIVEFSIQRHTMLHVTGEYLAHVMAQ